VLCDKELEEEINLVKSPSLKKTCFYGNSQLEELIQSKSKTFINFYRFAVRAEVDSRLEQLDHVIAPELFDSVRHPVFIQKCNIGIDPCHVLPGVWQPADSHVDQIFLYPYFVLDFEPELFVDWEVGQGLTVLGHDELDAWHILQSVNKFYKKFFSFLKSTKVEVG
jgi:hypothetical protein